MSGGDQVEDDVALASTTKKKILKRRTNTPNASIPSTIGTPSPPPRSSISPRKSTRTKVPVRRPSGTPSSPADENTTPTQQKASSSSPSSGKKSTAADLEEARLNAKKRVRERKLREQQERQQRLLQVDRSVSPSRRRRSDITPEEGRARAIARVRLRELQKKAALMGGTSVDDESTVAHISIQKIMTTLDMDAESCRDYLLGAGEKDFGDDHSMANSTMTTRRSVTIPKGPNFLLDQKYGQKGSPRRSQVRGPLDPSADDDTTSLAQSTVNFVDTLRDGDDQSTWYEGRVTIPNPPKFHSRASTSRRPPPKSTEEMELELMKQHKFKARPVPSTSKRVADSSSQQKTTPTRSGPRESLDSTTSNESPSQQPSSPSRILRMPRLSSSSDTTKQRRNTSSSKSSSATSTPPATTTSSSDAPKEVKTKQPYSFRARLAAVRPEAHQLSPSRRIAKTRGTVV